jgi:hypothetical protein
MDTASSILAPLQPYGIYLIAIGGILIGLGLIIGFFEKPAPVTNSYNSVAVKQSVPQDDVVARLEKLADLRNRGLISESDYESLKAKALQRGE